MTDSSHDSIARIEPRRAWSDDCATRAHPVHAKQRLGPPLVNMVITSLCFFLDGKEVASPTTGYVTRDNFKGWSRVFFSLISRWKVSFSPECMAENAQQYSLNKFHDDTNRGKLFLFILVFVGKQTSRNFSCYCKYQA